jgi:hypothetical protein
MRRISRFPKNKTSACGATPLKAKKALEVYSSRVTQVPEGILGRLLFLPISRPPFLD